VDICDADGGELGPELTAVDAVPIMDQVSPLQIGAVGTSIQILVGEAGHYLNRPGELRGGVLELLRANRDRLEQCVHLVDALRTLPPAPSNDVRATIMRLKHANEVAGQLPSFDANLRLSQHLPNWNGYLEGRTTSRMTSLLVPRAPTRLNPAAANIGWVPPQRNELE
jgi:hypothetical protein